MIHGSSIELINVGVDEKLIGVFNANTQNKLLLISKFGKRFISISEKMITNQNIMEELKVSKKEAKLRAQVKSRFYYLFWGAATVSVFAGQLYVGSGYRQMSRSFNRIMDAIVVEIQDQQRFY